jgi:hypothetical protein
MIPVMPFLLATVLAVAEDRDVSLDNVRRMVLLNQFAEAYEALIAMGRMDLVAKICAKVSSGVDRPAFWVTKDGVEIHSLKRVYTVRVEGPAEGPWRLKFEPPAVAGASSKHPIFKEMPTLLKERLESNLSWGGSLDTTVTHLISDVAENLDKLSRLKNVENFRMAQGDLLFGVRIDVSLEVFDEKFRKAPESIFWRVSRPESAQNSLGDIFINEISWLKKVYSLDSAGGQILIGGSKDVLAAAIACEEARLVSPRLSTDEYRMIAEEAIRKSRGGQP